MICVDYRRTLYFFGLLGVTLFLASGCSRTHVENQAAEVSEIQTVENLESRVSVTDVLKSPRVLALRQEHTLLLVDPEYGISVPIYTFGKDELPINHKLSDMQVTPDRQWVIWYTPSKGILALNTATQKGKQLYPPSAWLNTNPYLELDDAGRVYFTSDNGLVLNSIEPATSEHRKVTIPYPFGNVFRISPDGTKVLFTSGYAQDTDKPEFMFTDMNGNMARKFKTDTELFIRHIIAWSPESSLVMMLNGNVVEGYWYDNPEHHEPLFRLPDGSRAVDITRVGKLFFVRSDTGYWHVFDYATKKEIARTPTEIAAELQQPQFFPWSETQFLISEFISVDNTRYSRLWISTLRGSKKLIVPKYNETLVETAPAQLD